MAHFLLTELVKEHALKFGEFKLSSGAMSNYFIDMSKVTGHGEGLDIITFEIARLLSYDIDAVGGPLVGAAPLVSGTILAHRKLHFGLAKPLRGFYVRKEPKDGEYIEGYLKPGDKTIIVEDVVTTGNQTLRAIGQAEAAGAQVVGVIAVLDRLAGAKEMFGKTVWNFQSLLTIEDLGIVPNQNDASVSKE